jgi:spore coat protein U-like protein
VNSISKLLAVAGLLLAAVAPAGAATCSVSAVSLAFGNYDPFRITHTDTTGNVAVTCTGKAGEAVVYSIALNTGGSVSFATRRVKFGAATVNYNIYTTAARSIVWGDGSAGTALVTDSFSLPAAMATRNYAVFGRIFSGQNAQVGAYTDSIVVTLTF